MKRVLIISYYWPPAGGVGVIRNLKFVKYLRHFGWEPVVLVPDNADYPQLDHDNINNIPDGIEVLRCKIIEPFSLFRKFTGRDNSDKTNPVYVRESNSGFLDKFAIWVRGNFFIPDARSLWINPAVRSLSQYLQKHSVDAILTDGPPHTNTVIGQKISEKFNIPWLSDFQDPWTQVDYYAKMHIWYLADKKHKKLEQKTFQTAKKITVASPTWAKDLENIGAKDVDVIYYGYDEDDFASIPKPAKNDDEFVISHIGILGIDRQPDTMLKVLSKICQNNPEFKKKLRIKLAGSVDFSIKQKIKDYDLSNNFVDLGFISRLEAIKLTLHSDMLLLLVNKADNAKGRLPGKIYEYLRAQKPILSLGIAKSDVEQILTDTKTGQNIDYDNALEIENFILSVFNGENKFDFDMDIISQFSSENQTKIVAQYLDEITTSNSK